MTFNVTYRGVTRKKVVVWDPENVQQVSWADFKRDIEVMFPLTGSCYLEYIDLEGITIRLDDFQGLHAVLLYYADRITGDFAYVNVEVKTHASSAPVAGTD